MTTRFAFLLSVYFRTRMPLKLCSSSMSDVEAVTRLIFDAFRGSPVSELMYPFPTSESIIIATIDSSLKTWGQDAIERGIQVNDLDTGELISYSSWFFYPPREGEDWKKLPEVQWPEGWYHDNARTFQITHTEARNRIMGSKPYLCTGSPIHLIRSAFTPSYPALTISVTSSRPQRVSLVG